MNVLRCRDLPMPSLAALLGPYGLDIAFVDSGAPVPGSYWGGAEAGLIGDTLYLSPDTPVHSVLHEACHYVCMDPARRRGLDTDAGGDYDEENAVCYLQILLAGTLEHFGRDRMLADMDAWGYTFRLGSARAWFESDAADARAWLVACGLIDSAGGLTGRRRGDVEHEEKSA